MEAFMTTRMRNILIFIGTSVILLLLMVIAILIGRVPLNDENTVGNTPGNLNNGGYFCESDGRVYFANAYDGYALYSMNSDESDLRKLGEGSYSFLNVGGDYLYYSMIGNSDDYELGFIGTPYGVYRSTARRSPDWTAAI